METHLPDVLASGAHNCFRIWVTASIRHFVIQLFNL